MVSSLQTESEGVDLMTLLRETPREAYSYQQLGVRRATDVEPPPNQDRFNHFIARSFPPLALLVSSPPPHVAIPIPIPNDPARAGDPSLTPTR